MLCVLFWHHHSRAVAVAMLPPPSSNLSLSPADTRKSLRLTLRSVPSVGRSELSNVLTDAAFDHHVPAHGRAGQTRAYNFELPDSMICLMF